MKGVVFTEFMDMVDDKFGVATTEEIFKGADLPSGGAYTSIGTYDHAELISLVSNLSKSTNLDVPLLVRTFGTHMLGRFSEMFPDFFTNDDNVLSFLENVDGYIHGEVRKLYPDATLPVLITTRNADGSFEMLYKSKRMMGDLAEGLIAGAISHFGDTHDCHRTDLDNEDDKQCVKFVLTAKA